MVLNHPDRILVTLSSFAEASPRSLEALKASGIPFVLNNRGRRMTPEEVIKDGATCTGLVAGVEPYTDATLARLPALRCISRCGVGTDAIDHAAAAARGIIITNTPDEPTQAVAEHTLALLLGLLRRLPATNGLTKSRAWTRVPGTLLSGKTVGIVGLGRIGRRVCELLGPFGVHLLASDPRADEAWAREHAVTVVPYPTLLESSDVVSLHAALPAGSPPLIGTAELGRMRAGAWVLNVARGGLIDEAALVVALQNGQVAGAGLDVFADEPYSGPLCDLDNVILTPHQATLTAETRAAMELRAVENLIQRLQERP